MKEKNQKNAKSWVYKGLIAAVLTLLVMSGCQNIFEPPKMVEEIQAGTGTLSLSINGQGLGRTILPATVLDDFVKFKLEFTAEEETGNVDFSVIWIKEDYPDGTGTVNLNVGKWGLKVFAYLDPDNDAEPAAEGEVEDGEIIVTPAGTITANVPLKPLIDGEGTFIWDIEFPAIVTGATMTIKSLDEDGFEEILILVGETEYDQTFILLEAGCYSVVIELTNGQDNIELRETLYVYTNMESNFQFTFTRGHFPVSLLNYLLNARDESGWNFVDAGILAGHFTYLGINGVNDDNFDVLPEWFDTLCSSGSLPVDLATLKVLVDATLVSIASGDADFTDADNHEHRGRAETAVKQLIQNETGITDLAWSSVTGGDSLTVTLADTYTVTINFDGAVQAGTPVVEWEGLEMSDQTIALHYATFEGKDDVLHLAPGSTGYRWDAARYRLFEYYTNIITIDVSMDVWLDTPAKVVWQVDNTGGPVVCGDVDNVLAAGTWHNLTGSLQLTLEQYKSLYLNSGQLDGAEVYIANFTIMVTRAEGTQVSSWRGLSIPDATTAKWYSSYDGKTDVIHVAPTDVVEGYAWNVLGYGLNSYAGKLITVDVSVDVWVVDSPARVVWQIDHTGYPLVCGVSSDDLAAGQWHTLTGSQTLTLDAYKSVFLSTDQLGAAEVYIANFVITITELPPGGTQITSWRGLSIPTSPPPGTVMLQYDSYQGKNDVIRVSPNSSYSWYVLTYPLNAYDGAKITIDISMDIWLETDTNILWQVNVTGAPLVCGNFNELYEAGQWHTIQGQATVTLEDATGRLYLSTPQFGSTVAYISGFTINIQQVVDFSISFEDFGDMDEPIKTNETIYLLGGVDRPTLAEFSLAKLEQYDSIEWLYNGNVLTTDTLGSLTVSSAEYNNIQTYLITVKVTKDGHEFSKLIEFDVKP